MYIEDMVEELTEYCECAGFADFYNRVLKHKTKEEIVVMYKETFGDNEAQCE